MTQNIVPYWQTGANVFESLLDASSTAVTPPPTSSATKWGAFADKETESTLSAALARWEGQTGQAAQVVRVYDFGGWIPKLKADIIETGAIGTRDHVLSFESDGTHSLSNIAARNYDTEINTFLTYLTANRGPYTMYLTFGHEFDLKISAGTYTFAQWLPAFAHVSGLVSAHGDANIVMTAIWSSFAFTGSGGRFEPYWPGLAPYVQQIGLDPYQNLVGGGSSTHLAPDVFGPLLDEIHTFAGTDIPIGIGEAGWRAASSSSGISPNPLAYINSLTYLQDKVNWVCWFDHYQSGKSWNNHLDLNAGCPAAYGAIMAAAL